MARERERSRGSRGRGRKGNVVHIDLSDVEGRIELEEGEYVVVPSEASVEESSKGNDMITWKFKVTEGDGEGAILYFNTSLQKQALFNLRGLLEAMDQEIPDEPYDLDLDQIVEDEPEFLAIVGENEYNGKTTMRMVDYAPLKKKSKRSDKKDDKKDDRRGSRDERAPRNRDRGRGSKDKDKVSQDEVNDMDEGELEDLVKDNKLDVDLSDFSSLRKQKSAVIDTLEKEDLLKD